VLGSIRTFTTLPAATSPDAVTTSVSSLDTTSAVLNGTIDANFTTGGVKGQFEWAKDNGSTCADLQASSSSGVLQSDDGSGGTEDALLAGGSPTLMTYELSSLDSSTNYCYRIVALYGSGFSTQDTGDWVAFTTGTVVAQTISWGTSADPLPAGGSTTVEATATSGLAVTYTSVDTDICTVNSSTGAVDAVANSGTCTITATQAGGVKDGTTYSAAVPKSISFPIVPPVVTPAALVGGTFQTSGYSQTLAATGGDGTYSGWSVSSGSLPTGLSLSAAGVISGTPTAAGVYTFTVTVDSNSVTSAGQSFTIVIAKKVVTVTASSATVVYGAAAPTISPTYSGFVGSDVTTVSTGSNEAPSCTSTYQVGQNAGTTATSSCSGGVHGNYTYEFATGTVTVNKFPVTITALDAAKQNRVSGSDTIVEADPTLRWTASSPLPAGESIDDVVPDGVTISRASSGAAPGTYATAPAGEADGDYTITPSGTAGSNYTVTYVTGTFTIQEPKEVPSLTVSDKTMTYGDNNDADTFIGGSATNRASGSVAGTFAYTYVDADGSSVSLDGLSGLNAGTYLVSVQFTPDDTDAYYHDGSAPLTETIWLTVQRKTITVTAADKKKEVGALEPALTWSGSGYEGSDSDSDLGPVTISRASGETAGSYAITTTGGDTPNYVVTHVPGNFYIYQPVITVTQSRGVLTSREVAAEVRGAKAGATATFTITTSDTPSTLGTCTVASDGSCPVSTELASTVAQGVHTLKIESTDPLDATFSKTQRIILLASRIQVITPGGGDSGDDDDDDSPGVVPLVTPGGGVGNRPLIPRPPFVQPQSPVTAGPGVGEPGGPATTSVLRVLPSLPGLGGISNGPDSAGGPGSSSQRTVDFGDGIENFDSASSQAGEQTQVRGQRSLGELAGERLGGFEPGASTRVEILGSRTGARFVVSDVNQVDALIVSEAIRNSISAQAADFFRLEDVREIDTPPRVEENWSDQERQAIGEFFEAAGLANPVSMADIDPEQFTEWVQVTGSASTYLPGSVVYLTLTSQPLVIASGEVSREGNVVLTGSLPVEWLGPGEHRVRLVGLRALDGVSVDSFGEVQLSDELLNEIERFDLGTQSTIAVIGPNLTGGDHVALRVVPLVPTAPWWTLWLILGGFLLFGAARWRGLLDGRGRKALGMSVIVASAVPAVILGWLSTVTAVVWAGLGLMLAAIAVALIWPPPRHISTQRRA